MQNSIISYEQSKVVDLEERLANSDNEKIRLYEALIKEKDEVIKSLHFSVDLITETKDFSIKQMNSQINDLQNALAFKNTFNLHCAQGVGTNIDLKDNIIGKTNVNQLQDMQKETELLETTNKEDKVLISELKSKIIENDTEKANLKVKIAELEFKIKENDTKMKELEAKFEKNDECLKAKITELEIKVKTNSAELTKKDNQLSKITSSAHLNLTLPLNFTKNSKIKVAHPIGIDPFMGVFENIPSAGSNWMVIQRRIDGNLLFNRFDQSEYDNGFGDLKKEFWVGFEVLHQLTNMGRFELYIQVVDFDDVTAYARYDHFVVGSKAEGYIIRSLGAYSGNAGDALKSLKNKKVGYWRCQNHTSFQWWYSDQMKCNLNGSYDSLEPRTVAKPGKFWWGNWKMAKSEKYLKSCKMLIRQV
ncbi:fibrinogen-like protein 1 isoform X2 [Drosophila rhopaloa]|nr:fibrinogen-like protein 1 isoform X2 [Drosophila rhopaloa]